MTNPKRYSVVANSIDAYRVPNSIVNGQSLQLSQGAFTGEIDLYALDGLWLTRRCATQMVLHTGEIPGNHIVIGFMAGEKSFVGADGIAFTEGELAASYEPRRFQHIIPGGAEFFGVRLSQELLQTVCGPETYSRLVGLLETSAPRKFKLGLAQHLLIEKTRAFFTQVQHEQQLSLAELESAKLDYLHFLVCQLTEEHLWTARTNTRARIFQRCIGLMLDTPVAKISLDEISHVLGTSRRNLEQIFSERTGLSPLEFTNKLRLNSARTALLNAEPGDTVATIARSCGYKHMGKFSSSYSCFFGELPSVSLRRQNEKKQSSCTVL